MRMRRKNEVNALNNKSWLKFFFWRQVYHLCAVDVLTRQFSHWRTRVSEIENEKPKYNFIWREVQSRTIWLVYAKETELGKLRFHHRRSHGDCLLFGWHKRRRKGWRRKNTRKEKEQNFSIINALLKWIFKSENFFAHFHFKCQFQFQFLEIDFLFSSPLIFMYKSKNIIKTVRN